MSLISIQDFLERYNAVVKMSIYNLVNKLNNYSYSSKNKKKNTTRHSKI